MGAAAGAVDGGGARRARPPVEEHGKWQGGGHGSWRVVRRGEGRLAMGVRGEG
jgi:hypothetical protein